MERISIIINLSQSNNFNLISMIETLQKQTYGFENIELILLDNNLLSLQEKKILKNFIDPYRNIKFISLDITSNLNQAYAIAMKFVSSDYIMILNDNQYFLENGIELLYTDIKNDVEVIIGNCINLPLNVNINQVQEKNLDELNKYMLDFSDFPLKKNTAINNIPFKMFSEIFLNCPKIFKMSFIKKINPFNSKNFEEELLFNLTKITLNDEPITISQDTSNVYKRINNFKEKNQNLNSLNKYAGENYPPSANPLIKKDSFESKPTIRVIIIDSNTNDNSSSKIIPKLSNDIPLSILTDNRNFLVELNDFIEKIDEDFICILYNGDIIEQDIFEYIENELQSKNINNIGAIIFDDIKHSSSEEVHNFKPGFSPELYLEYDYVHNSVLINKNLLLKYGGFNTNFKNNYIRDAILRLYENGYEIIKEDILGFKINENFSDINENELFINETLKRRNCNFTINKENDNLKPIYCTENKKASIIIPFKDQMEVTKVCINSILEKTTYEDYEIILINNNSYEKETFEYIKQISSIPNIKIFDYLDSFNWSKINNFGALKSDGDVFVFLNNDTEIISPDWLTQLVGDSIQEGVGSVGAKLFFEDNTIQHAGIVLGLNGLAGHLFAGEYESEIPKLYNNYRRNVSAVTGACVAINREVFEEIHGFDETFEVNFSDIEICLRLMEKGYRNVYNPNVKLIHYEWKTKGKNYSSDHDRILCYSSFKPYLNSGDPFFNKNLSFKSNKILMKDETNDYKTVIDSFWSDFFNIKSKKIEKINNFKDNIQINQNILKYNLSENDLIKNEILMKKFFNEKKLKKDTILWFFPSLNEIPEKDIFNIIKIADYLSLKENSQHIFVLEDFETSKNTFSSIRKKFVNLNFEVISLYDFNNKKTQIKSDIGFCVNWSSAFNLVKYNDCMAKFYFIPTEDLSDDFDLKNILIEETYRFNFIGITSSIVQRKKYEQYNKNIFYFVPFFDNSNYFAPTNKIIEKNVQNILFYGNPDDVGFELGINILKIIKQYYKHHVEIFSIGADYDVNEYHLEGIITNLGIIESNEKLSKLYRETDLVLMFMEKDLLTKALEILASGCILITNINEYTQNLLKHNENVILTKPILDYATEDIINLLNNGIIRNRVYKNSLKSVSILNENEELDRINMYLESPLDNEFKWRK